MCSAHFLSNMPIPIKDKALPTPVRLFLYLHNKKEEIQKSNVFFGNKKENLDFCKYIIRYYTDSL